MKIIITEEQKKKLFIPRKLNKGDSRYDEWNNKQPVRDGVRINQYDYEGKKQGYWEFYYLIGDGKKHKIFSKGSYVNGKKDGYWEDYWENGQLYCKGLYKNGKKYGVWVYYRKNGDLFFKTKNLIDENIDDLKESKGPKKGKLFIPRKIDEREKEKEKLKQQYISEIKSIVEKEGPINYDDLEDDSPSYEPENTFFSISFFTRYELDRVEVTIYNAVTGKEEDSYFINYEELDLKELYEIKDVLKNR